MDRLPLSEAVLGYLELSDGTPSPSFQQSVDRLFRSWLAEPDGAERAVWVDVRASLMEAADHSKRLGPLLRAREIVALVHDFVLPAYRRHHQDLLAHLPDRDLFTSFFLVRCYEAALAHFVGGERPMDESAGIVVEHLNDFLGHRPIAVLENRQSAQPYSHERVRPIPIYLRSAGVAAGRYETLVDRTLAILRSAPPAILEAASMELDLLDELSVDPRAYDHSHPVNQRPGYQFGEWDPDFIDSKGRYRRFVLRRMILEALREWIGSFEGGVDEAEHEAAAALAGTMLLASGISGRGPGAFSSEISLAHLVPRVAAYRDEFYRHLLEREEGKRGERLRDESARLRQPFGGVRSFLNQYVARQRAEQLQRDRLSLLFAHMGYTEASRAQAAKIDVPATRMRSQIECLIESSRRLSRAGDVVAAADRMVEAEDLLHRAIECGAMVDPWNILGFQGNFPRFPSVEDAVSDTRVDVLLATVQSIFAGYALALREAAVVGDSVTQTRLEERFDPLVAWWDRFATVEVSGVRRVSGAESSQAAQFVARSLAEWRLGGKRTGDVAFWRERASDFTSAQSFGLVVKALIEKDDYLSAMALLMQWLSMHELVPLEDAGESLHELALRWMASVVAFATNAKPLPRREGAPPVNPSDLATKFLDYLEVNAEGLWQVPKWGDELADSDEERSESDANDGATGEDVFSAAYEGVTYKDETDDGVEGSLAGESTGSLDESISEAEALMARLRFIGTISRLWYVASDPAVFASTASVRKLENWIDQATRNKKDLVHLLERLERQPITPPSVARDSMIEFERQSSIRETLISKAIYIFIETSHALRKMLALAAKHGVERSAGLTGSWEAALVAFESAARFGDLEKARALLPSFIDAVREAPLMYVATDKGGRPTQIGPARYARDAIRILMGLFPSIGEFRGARDLLEAILLAEQQQSYRGTQMQVSEFDPLFRDVFRKVMEQLARQLSQWSETRENDLLACSMVNRVVEQFSSIWTRHTNLVRISEMESIRGKTGWEEFRSFVKKYGRDWFTQAFLSEANLWGVVRQGTEAYLAQLLEESEDLAIVRAIHAGKVTLDSAAERLAFVARVIIENYDEYRDYNTTTPQSDYGDNLHLLVDLLSHKVEFERYRWGQEPTYIAHSVLLEEGQFGLAAMLREEFDRRTTTAARTIMTRLEETESRCGFRLQSIRGRMSEGFVGPLRLDQVLALAQRSLSPPPDGRQAFASLTEEVEDLTKTQHGSGIEVPEWLRRLEVTVDNALDQTYGRLLDYEDLVPPRSDAVLVTWKDFFEQMGGEE